MRVGGLIGLSESRAVRREWNTRGPKRLAVAVGALRKSAKIR
jgi:hypothetical protein